MITNRCAARLAASLPLTLVLGCASLISLPSAAQPTADDYRTLNRALIEQHIVPRYAELATASEALATAASEVCENAPDTAGISRLQDTFAAASDAWQAVQHVRFGPTELFMRGTRLAFWPDPRGAADSQLKTLLASGDPARLAADQFSDNGVAVQGFPALERLLFGDGAAALKAGTADIDYRCDVLVAMTRNIDEMTAGLVDDWSKFVAELVVGDGIGGFYQGPEEVTLDLFKSLYNTVELAVDHKLARAAGTGIADARPQQTEAWRSGRSLINIRINLAAGADMLGGDTDSRARSDALTEARTEPPAKAPVDTARGKRFADAIEDPELRALLGRAFRQTQATAAALDVPLEQALTDPAKRPQVDKLLREMAALKALLAQRLPPALGIPLGFNALDGD